MTVKKKATKKKAAKKTTAKRTTTKRKRKPRRTGQPTKLTPAVHKSIVKDIKLGIPQRIAAAAVGVSEAAVNEWITRGQGLDNERSAIEPYVSFALDVLEARRENTKFHVGTIVRAAKGDDWRASAWYLARMQPEFRDQSRIEHAGVKEIKMVFDEPTPPKAKKSKRTKGK